MSKLLQLDLWQTVCAGLPYDPIYRFQRIIGHRLDASNALGVDPDPKLLTACLTLNAATPRDFADKVTQTLGLNSINADQLKQFEELLESERNSVSEYWDVEPAIKALRSAGFTVCLNSNLWPFAADHILNRHGLATHFDGLVLSYKEGVHKDQPESYMVAPRAFGVSAEGTYFAGDSLQNDCIGPMQLGISPFLLDRAGTFEGKQIPPGVTRVRNLMQMTEALVR